MVAEKKKTQEAGIPKGLPPTDQLPAPKGERKAWVPKTPVDVVLTQIHRQEARVAALQQDLETEKTLLVRLQKAKAVLEA